MVRSTIKQAELAGKNSFDALVWKYSHLCLDIPVYIQLCTLKQITTIVLSESNRKFLLEISRFHVIFSFPTLIEIPFRFIICLFIGF